MRIIKLQNKKIKDILKKKEEIVLKGRKLSAKIEEEAKVIVNKELEANGIKVDKNRKCSGDYDKFVKFFHQDNQIAINENIKKELADELDELEKLNGFVNKYNGEISRLVDKEDIKIGEFEELRKIELKKEDIEIEVIDKIEEMKQRIREQKTK
jgi:Mg2+ and Co2+ transporter CorA